MNWTLRMNQKKFWTSFGFFHSELCTKTKKSSNFVPIVWTNFLIQRFPHTHFQIKFPLKFTTLFDLFYFHDVIFCKLFSSSEERKNFFLNKISCSFPHGCFFVQNRLASFKDVVLLIPVAGFEKKEPIEGNPKVS